MVVIPIGLGGAKKCGGGFKVIILKGAGEGAKPQKGDQFLSGYSFTHHEGRSYHVILLF